MARRRVTARDVAKRAGVSQTTVSFVLNDVAEANITEETRQRVMAAARALHYVPDAAAQALARRRTQVIGLVFSRSYQHLSSHAFLLQIMEGLMTVVRQHDLRLLLDSVDGQKDENAYLNLARAKSIDGLILIEPRSDDAELPVLVEEAFPVVLIGNRPDMDICSVDVDNHAGARVAVEHLVSLGHTRIGCITNAPVLYTVADERLMGYQDALKAAGIPPDDRWVRYGEYTPESGIRAMGSLLDEAVLPTAVFVASDVVAFGAMHAIHERGLRIPDDIAIVGFEDTPLASLVHPPLTTIRIPAVDEGRVAGELLFDLILRREVPCRRQLLETDLIVRASSIGNSD